MAKSNIGNDRGKFLTAMLVIAAIGIIFSFWGLISGTTQSMYQDMGAGGMVALLWVMQIVGIGYIYGIWNWQKWGVYLLAAGFAVSLMVQFMYHDALSTNLPNGKNAVMIGYVFSFIVIGLWYWAISRKWKYFK